MAHDYLRVDLYSLDTISQAWDGDELKIEQDGCRVWLVLPENRQYNGDYVVEIYENNKWVQINKFF